METSKSSNGYIIEIDFTKLETISEKYKLTPRQLLEIFSDVHAVSEQHNANSKEAWLGNATTFELIDELRARAEVHGYGKYHTTMSDEAYTKLGMNIISQNPDNL